MRIIENQTNCDEKDTPDGDKDVIVSNPLAPLSIKRPEDCPDWEDDDDDDENNLLTINLYDDLNDPDAQLQRLCLLNNLDVDIADISLEFDSFEIEETSQEEGQFMDVSVMPINSDVGVASTMTLGLNNRKFLNKRILDVDAEADVNNFLKSIL